MQGDIFNSKGVRVGVIVGREIFDLNGTKLYDLKGTNIYRLSGEFIGHLNDASGSDKRLDGGVAASLASLLVDKSMRQFSEHTRVVATAISSGQPMNASGRQQLSPDSFTILRAIRGRNGECIDFAWAYANWRSSGINAGRSPRFHQSSDEPLPFVDIELHQAFVSHFQQKGLARFFIRNIGAFHDLVHFERLLAKRPQDIFLIIQHDQTPTVIKRAKSLRIRKLIFRNDSLDILRLALDAVSKTSICLDGHKLNDGVNRWWVSCGTSLWTLGLMTNVLIQLIGI